MRGDVMRKKNIFDVIQILSVTIAIIFCFYNTQTVIDAVKQAMLLCYENVIPSLFVFMVIAAFMSQLKCSYLLSIPFTPVFRLLNINNRRIITYYLFSILSGFASGGYFIDRMRNEFNCSENMIGVISIITTNNSPAFVISAVGASMLNNISSGVILYCSIIISSFITAFIFSFIFPYSPVLSIKNQDKIRNSLSEALTSSVYAMINTEP